MCTCATALAPLAPLAPFRKKINEFILCFASIVFIPPPFHISPVSRGRATFYYLGLLGDKIFALGRKKINEFYFVFCARFCTFVGRLQNTITNNWRCQLTLMTPSGEIEKALRIKEAYYADKQSQNSRLRRSA